MTTSTSTSTRTPTTALDAAHEHTVRCWWDLTQARWTCATAPLPPVRR